MASPQRHSDRNALATASVDQIEGRDGFVAATAHIRPALSRHARRLDPQNWEDLIQDTLVRAWRARGSFQPGTNFKSWIFTILRNCFLSGLSKSRGRVAWIDQFADRLVQPADQESALLERELASAIASLKADQREALVAVSEAQMSYAEAADHLGVSMPTLKSRVFRARAAVVAFLERGERVSYNRLERTS